MNVEKIKTAVLSVLSSIAIAVISFICGKHLHNHGKREDRVREDIGNLQDNTERLGTTEEKLRGNNEKFTEWLNRLTERKSEKTD
jgi:hypothetical protein